MDGNVIRLPFAGEATSSGVEPGRTVRIWRGLAALALLVISMVILFQADWSGKDQSEPPVRVCDIKGNIGIDGDNVYHMPGGKWYDKTQIEAARGERWFCSEDEARGAGWRKSLN